MFQYVRYFNQAQGVRSRFGSLPGWARLLVMLAALPGIVLAILSLLALLVSILALLLLTVPVYRVLQTLCIRPGQDDDVTVNVVVDPTDSPGRRQVDVKVIE